MKRILKSTLNYGLLYSSDVNVNVVGYGDADYTGDITIKRSTFGSAFCVGKGIIAWNSQKQKSVSLSTTVSVHSTKPSSTEAYLVNAINQ